MDNEWLVDMRYWRQEKRFLIDEIVASGGLFEEKVWTKPGVLTPVSTVAELGSFTIRAMARLEKCSQRIIYLCCEECRFRINVDYNSLFICNRCGLERVAKPRFRFVLNAFDDTGSLEVTVFGTEGDPIIGMSAQSFYERTIKDEAQLIDYINGRLKDLAMVMHITSAHFTGKNGVEVTVYTLSSMEIPNDSTGFNLLLTPTSKKHAIPTSTTTLESGGGGSSTKKKLDFGPSLGTHDASQKGQSPKKRIQKRSLKAVVLDDESSDDELNVVAPSLGAQDASQIGDISARRRLVKKGKSKIGEEDVSDEPDDVESFALSTLHSDPTPGQGSSEDELPLSDLLQSNKIQKMAKETIRRQTDQSELSQSMTDTIRLATSCMKPRIHVTVKTEKGQSPKKHIQKRSLKAVVLDDESSDDELNVVAPSLGARDASQIGCMKSNIPESVETEKASTRQILTMKKSTRGRVIKPKKFD